MTAGSWWKTGSVWVNVMVALAPLLPPVRDYLHQDPVRILVAHALYNLIEERRKSMSPESILKAIAALGVIVGSGIFLFRWISWKTKSTPDAGKQSIDQQEEENKRKAEETGLPQ